MYKYQLNLLLKEILGRFVVVEAQNNCIWLHGANA